jgi:hypothetical protein
MSIVSTGTKSECAVIDLNPCATFKRPMIEIDDECYPDWFVAFTPKKPIAGRASVVFVPRSVYSGMVSRSQISSAKFVVPRLSKSTSED